MSENERKDKSLLVSVEGRCATSDVTPEMVEAGFRVLAASGLEGVIEGVDSLLVEEIYRAMLAAAQRPSS